MKIKKQIAVYLFTVAFAGMGSSMALAANKKDAESICDAAEQSRKAAAKAKMEWTTTSGLIKNGKKAIAGGKFDEAVKLCEKAKFQGDASVKQAAIEEASWESRAPK